MHIQNMNKVGSGGGVTPGNGAGSARPAAVDVPRPAELQAPAAATAPPPDAAAVRAAVKEINQVIRSFSRNLEFTVDEATRKTIVKVVDTDTGEVIRQIPSEETLTIARALDQLQGLIIRQKA